MHDRDSEKLALPRIDKRIGWVVGCLLLLGGIWLLIGTGRGSYLGYLAVLACPLMHVFMMRGMGHGGHGSGHAGHGSGAADEGPDDARESRAGCHGGSSTDEATSGQRAIRQGQ